MNRISSNLIGKATKNIFSPLMPNFLVPTKNPTKLGSTIFTPIFASIFDDKFFTTIFF